MVIATCDRESTLANRAIASVLRQTRAPDFLVVVDDSHPRHREANRRIVDAAAVAPNSPRRVRYLLNDRTPGASGAWNVGLDWLHRQVDDSPRVFVTILDDDDAWEPEHLARCLDAATARGLDMVAADIVRHEGTSQTLQPAPEALEARAFLTHNPGIQGSNLFVRLSALLAAGLFDEALASTTDRDLCIRLAASGSVRYARLPHALVHHHADDDRPRLSTSGSGPKRAGLDGFFWKYQGHMSKAERDSLCERAARLFDWQPTPASLPPPPARSDVVRGDSAPLSLVVATITQSTVGASLPSLLDDLRMLRADTRLRSLEVIVLENGPRGPTARGARSSQGTRPTRVGSPRSRSVAGWSRGAPADTPCRALSPRTIRAGSSAYCRHV